MPYDFREKLVRAMDLVIMWSIAIASIGATALVF
jgi:hypothetical protein